ncbi:hypothetical protein PAT3040_00864 [Paenibacillus agaridevorans]|uniref:Uncharacterized protein n=1 Tax=Paenibacillus agaridevorans TaxID=171404 RepID=A0A2R5EL27_9BACL|nr:hypothetical protein [Paenibacillus agaridevorans]GBG06339.1 hypothetical protein PAT3040_00864 [Paenibacillus agaridevorans]
MKLKKFFIVVVAICMLSISQSAFASTATPFVVGIGDTSDAAIPLADPIANQVLLFLSNSSDVDWYVWENTSSVPKFVTGYLDNNAATQFQLASQVLINSNYSSLVFNPENSFYSIYLPPGGKAFFRVGATSSTVLSSNYDLMVVAWDA